jgi:hypothetical protein
VIGHSPSPGPLALRLESFLGRTGWPVRLVRFLGIRPAVKTVEHSVLIADGSPALPTLRLAFASDFHAGGTTDPAVLHSAIAALHLSAPDVLLLGGDYIGVHPGQIDWLAPELGSIPAPLGRFAVLGNHDRWVDADYVIRRLEEAGIQVLINRSVRLPTPYEDVWICGLDDEWSGQPDPQAALHGATGVRILLMHSPSGLLAVGAERFDLALCGHTHGGQIALPGGIPVLLPRGPLTRKFARGRFALGHGRTMIVSVGLGCSAFPIRTFAAPEILLCRLETDRLEE